MTVPNSFSGKAIATTLTADVSNVATSFTVASASTWTETVGSHIGQPLGTSGNFVVTLDYGQSTEEKVLCSAIAGSGPYTITVVQRGYDGTSAVGHYYASAYPVVHTYSADVPQQANLGVTNAATAQTTADTAVSNAATAQTAANAAQTTANTALTNAYGVNLTSTTPMVGTNPSSPAVLKQYTFSTTVTPSSFGTATVTFPVAFTRSVLGVVPTMCYTGVHAGAYVVMDSTVTLSTITLYFFASPGTLITNGTYRVNVTVCGY